MYQGLREIELGDIPKINQWRNDRGLVALLGNNFNYIAGDVDLAWYEDYLRNRDKARRFAILWGEGVRIVGTIQLTGIHAVNRSAEFSIFIGDEEMRGKGIGMAASREVIRHGFEDINLYRIWLTVLSGNARARHLYEELGFVHEGIMRKAVYKQGRYEDLLLMAVLRDEYFTNVSIGDTAAANGLHHYLQP